MSRRGFLGALLAVPLAPLLARRGLPWRITEAETGRVVAAGVLEPGGWQLVQWHAQAEPFLPAGWGRAL